MKYKIGDKVRIKSIDWYNANKDEVGDIPLIQMCDAKYNFVADMSCFCGKTVTINNVSHRGYYDINEDDCCYYWTDEMFEGLVDETEPQDKMVSLDKVVDEFRQFIVDYFPNLFRTGEEVKEVMDLFRKRLEE